MRARAPERADAARGAVAHAFARGASAVASTNAMTNDATTSAMSAMQAMRARRTREGERGGGGESADGRVTRAKSSRAAVSGKMVEGVVVQPAGMPVVLLEVRGEVMDRTALPMGKDVLVKGEMITVGKWLASVSSAWRARRRTAEGVGATDGGGWVQARERLKRYVESAAARAGGRSGGGGGDDDEAEAAGARPLLVTTPDAGDTTESGWIGGAGDAEEIFSRYERSVGALAASSASARADARVAEAIRFTNQHAAHHRRAADPNTGERERWMAGGWRGRAGGDERPRG